MSDGGAEIALASPPAAEVVTANVVAAAGPESAVVENAAGSEEHELRMVQERACQRSTQRKE